MRRVEPAVSVRSPEWLRAVGATWPFLSLLGLANVGRRLARGDRYDSLAEPMIVTAVFVVSGLAIWRASRLATVAVGDRLLIRNWMSELRLDRQDIGSFDLPAHGEDGAAHVVLVDGRRIRLAALGNLTNQARRSSQVGALRQWLAEGSNHVQGTA